MVGTGDLTLTFVPAVGADASLATNGIKMLATITVVYTGTEAPTYTGVDAYDQAVEVVPIKAATNNTITITGNGVTEETKITAAQIVGALDFCEESAGKTVKLPTKAANDAFHEVLKKFTIKITITEVIS